MGLLAKTNPTATRQSVIQQAIIWGAISAVVCAGYFLWTQSAPLFWPIILLVVAILGAGLGALMEWQLDDGVEIYWIVLEAEDVFSVKIPQWEDIETVGDLYQAVVVSLRAQLPNESDAQTLSDDEVWNRLKAMLVHQLKIKPEQVVESARFYGDLGL